MVVDGSVKGLVQILRAWPVTGGGGDDSPGRQSAVEGSWANSVVLLFLGISFTSIGDVAEDLSPDAQ